MITRLAFTTSIFLFAYCNQISDQQVEPTTGLDTDKIQQNDQVENKPKKIQEIQIDDDQLACKALIALLKAFNNINDSEIIQKELVDDIMSQIPGCQTNSNDKINSNCLAVKSFLTTLLHNDEDAIPDGQSNLPDTLYVNLVLKLKPLEKLLWKSLTSEEIIFLLQRVSEVWDQIATNNSLNEQEAELAAHVAEVISLIFNQYVASYSTHETPISTQTDPLNADQPAFAR